MTRFGADRSLERRAVWIDGKRRRMAALVWLQLLFATVTSTLFLAPARSQQAGSPPEVPLGMIVTRTAEEAQAVLNELKAGMDFGVLAKEKSVDPSSDDGGYIGGLSSAQLTPALRDTLKGLQSRQFTSIVRVPRGFAILTVFPAAPKTQDLNAKQIQSLATAGVVRQTINVAGMSEEDSVFEQYPKPANWKQDLRQPCAIRKASHPLAVERMERLLAGSGGNPAPLELLRGHVALAELHAFAGEMDKSIKEWQSAYQIAQSDVPGAIPYLQEALGVSYLHLSEMENGVYRDSGSLDLFPPLIPGSHFDKPANSRLAIQYFLSFLQRAPEGLQVRWLLKDR